MAKQTINQGTAPTGAGGDTFRSGSAKLQANDDELYAHLGAGSDGILTVAKSRAALGLGTAAALNEGLLAANLSNNSNIGEAFGAFADKYYSPSYHTNNLNNFPFGVTTVFNPAFKELLNCPQPGITANGLVITLKGSNYGAKYQFVVIQATGLKYFRSYSGSAWTAWVKEYSTANTTVDSNGFIKAASPIVQLFANKIELNDEAEQQNIEFEKLGVGDYLVKGSSGFAQEGWYVETPKDANGNVLFSVIYTTLENGDISVKTYKKKFDLETASIVADLTQPVDITENRWIDLRLQELPQPEIEVTDDTE